jgi:hypothetical protein
MSTQAPQVYTTAELQFMSFYAPTIRTVAFAAPQSTLTPLMLQTAIAAGIARRANGNRFVGAASAAVGTPR